MKNLAPIILIVYNRPEHTKKTLTALKSNTLALDSKLFIYSDAAKTDLERGQVEEVRRIVENVSGFKEVTVVKQADNLGLAKSIIDGVTEIVNTFGRVIVLEDDLVTGRYFLEYMNSALDYYHDIKTVWHISGWGYPIDDTGLKDVFFWRVMNCWGWGTWSDRWQHFDKNTDRIANGRGRDGIKAFNLDGEHNFWQQVLANRSGEIDTWAIFWYATIFENNGLCLNPVQTLVDNIGLDGSGVHCSANEAYRNRIGKEKRLNVEYNTTLEECTVAVKRIKGYYKSFKKPLIIRAMKKLSQVFRRIAK